MFHSTSSAERCVLYAALYFQAVEVVVETLEALEVLEGVRCVLESVKDV